MIDKIKVSTPGRICLFGEHQDYLNLPVIACAINRRITIEGLKTSGKTISLELPDVNSKEKINLNRELSYIKERDYFRSSINVMKKKGFTFSCGFSGSVNGNIPINSGTSSSTALILTWLKVLSLFSDQPQNFDEIELAELAFQAEVVEFDEPGGKMDMYSCSLGGINFIDFEKDIRIEKLNPLIAPVILGDSREEKNTTQILKRVKDGVIAIKNILMKINPEFSFQKIKLSETEYYKNDLTLDQLELLRATIRNYQITNEAKKILYNGKLDHASIGKLLNEHHKILRDVLKISTPKIETMIKAAIDNGALGAKINGSGGGGCMFAYAPEDSERVAKAVEKVGGLAYIVKPDRGVIIH